MNRIKRKGGLKRWGALAAGLAGLALFVTLLHLISPRLPGTTGELLRNNRDNNIEATALIYTESGDVSDYLDKDNGKYSFRTNPSR